MTINERVKAIRKSKEVNLTLEKFGERLGLKKNTLSAIETGRNALTEQNIKAICREFNVDYIWLTTGVGEMFVDTLPEDEVAALVTDLLIDGKNNAFYGLILSIMSIYKRSSPAAQEALNDLIDSVYLDMQRRKNEKKEDYCPLRCKYVLRIV